MDVGGMDGGLRERERGREREIHTSDTRRISLLREITLSDRRRVCQLGGGSRRRRRGRETGGEEMF